MRLHADHNIGNRSYIPTFTFPRDIIPKTTNKTAGHTPYINLAKRKVEYEQELGKNQSNYASKRTKVPKVLRSVRKGQILSYAATSAQNKLFYDILPDGVICAYAAKGYPTGLPGFLQPALRALTETLTQENRVAGHLSSVINITSVLPVKDGKTNHAQQLTYANGKKTMDVQAIIYVYDNVEENTVANGDTWCNNLISQFKFPPLT